MPAVHFRLVFSRSSARVIQSELFFVSALIWASSPGWPLPNNLWSRSSCFDLMSFTSEWTSSTRSIRRLAVSSEIGCECACPGAGKVVDSGGKEFFYDSGVLLACGKILALFERYVSMKAILVLLFCLPVYAAPKVFVSDKNHQPGNAQQVSNLNKSCPEIKIVGVMKDADFAVVWDSKTWNETTWGGHQQEWFLYNQDAEVIASGMSHKISNAAKDICKAITKANKP
jgi:hypothetical protein